MFETKIFEVRDGDRMALAISVALGQGLAIKLQDHLMIEHAKIGPCSVYFGLLNNNAVQLPTDPAAHRPDEALETAHRYAIEHWDDLRSGDVLDIQFVRGETDSPRPSSLQP